MRAVVIGGSGHIGTYLVPMLAKAGYDTISITRGKNLPYVDDPAWKAVTKIQLDRNGNGFAGAIGQMHPDIVIDLIGFHRQEVIPLVQVLKQSGCSHYIFCSSCWAHGRAGILPLLPDQKDKEPLDEYGKEKFYIETYLKEQFYSNGFPATIIMPGQISGPGWIVMNPWANKTLVPFQKIAAGEPLMLPNFGMETLHHVHAYDVAQCFFLAVTHRERALGETFDAASGGSITLYGYARMMYDFFKKRPHIGFLPWDAWCQYVGDPKECEDTYFHIARSGFYSIDKERDLLDYHPKFSNTETIRLAVQSYIDRGLIHGMQ